MFRISRSDVEFRSDRARLVQLVTSAEAAALAEELAVEEAPPDAMNAQRAEAEMRQAREAIERMIRDARAQADAIREEARAQGLAQGLAEAEQGIERERQQRDAALARARDELDARRREIEAQAEASRAEDAAALRAALASIEAAKADLFAELTDAVCELSLAVAAKILQQKLAKTKAIEQIAAEAIGAIRDEGRIVVRLCPQDAQRLTKGGAALPASEDGVLPDIVEDDALARGDCIVETGRERVDAGVMTQLKNLRDAFARLEG